jgi:hypothetical protein
VLLNTWTATSSTCADCPSPLHAAAVAPSHAAMRYATLDHCVEPDVVCTMSNAPGAIAIRFRVGVRTAIDTRQAVNHFESVG